MISPSSFLASPSHAVARKSALTWLAVTGALGAAACSDQSAPTAPARLDAAALAIPNTWETKSPIPSRGYLLQAGALDGIIYVVGGYTVVPEGRALQAYNVATNTWSARRTLPSPRHAVHGASAINGRLYVTGGQNNSEAGTRTLFVYHPATNTWARKADLPVASSCGAQAVIAGQLYVYAGCTRSGRHFFWRYNPTNNTWAARRAPPTVHKYPAAGSIGGRFYLAGGNFATGTPNPTLDVYNPAANSWVTRAPLPRPVAAPASGVINNKLYVAGGDDGSVQAVLSVYNPATNSWTNKTPMQTARWGSASVVANGRFFVIAGYGGNSGNTAGVRDEVEAYTP